MYCVRVSWFFLLFFFVCVFCSSCVLHFRLGKHPHDHSYATPSICLESPVMALPHPPTTPFDLNTAVKYFLLFFCYLLDFFLYLSSIRPPPPSVSIATPHTYLPSYLPPYLHAYSNILLMTTILLRCFPTSLPRAPRILWFLHVLFFIHLDTMIFHFVYGL